MWKISNKKNVNKIIYIGLSIRLKISIKRIKSFFLFFIEFTVAYLYSLYPICSLIIADIKPSFYNRPISVEIFVSSTRVLPRPLPMAQLRCGVRDGGVFLSESGDMRFGVSIDFPPLNDPASSGVT